MSDEGSPSVLITIIEAPGTSGQEDPEVWVLGYECCVQDHSSDELMCLRYGRLSLHAVSTPSGDMGVISERTLAALFAESH